MARIDVPAREDEADAWLRDSLGQGRVLGPELLRRIDSSPGQMLVCLGTELPPDVGHFNVGRGVSVDDTSAALGQWLEGRIAQDAVTVIAEDPFMRPSDPVFTTRIDNSIVLGDGVCHWRTFDREEFATVGRFVVASTGYPMTALLLPGGVRFSPGQVINTDAIRKYVGDALLALVGAFDNEGFLIWVPSPAPVVSQN